MQRNKNLETPHYLFNEKVNEEWSYIIIFANEELIIEMSNIFQKIIQIQIQISDICDCYFSSRSNKGTIQSELNNFNSQES